MTNFVHLHVHSEYSLLDGSSRIFELPKKAKELGMNSIALTDHGSMYGIIQFYKECLKENIKPILGAEIYVTPGDMLQKDTKNRLYYHLILLAENNKGYENLIKIVSEGYVNGYYYKPRVDYEILKKYHEGLIATSACISGEVQRTILDSTYEDAKERALFYENIFGKNNFFLELQDHGMDEQKFINRELKKLSKDTNIPLICANDSHYLEKEDYQAHDVLLCIQTGKIVQDEDRMKFPSAEFYLKSPEEMYELFKDVPEALENTQKIADRCNVNLEFHKLKLPHFDTPKNYTNEEYLEKLCEEGLKNRYENITEKIRKRYEYEISTIKEMGYVDYFLIVSDFVRFAKSKNIPVGPGRGSAAGSIVSFILGITDIDPMEFGLLFERFLNPERVSMPDIDIDFCYERREEVIDYVIKKYGKEKVAQIVTFGTMKARMAIRDVGRALDVSYGKCDQIAKMIPQELGMTIDLALEMNKDLKILYENDYEAKRIIDISKILEGLPRHTSTHAAGVLISGAEVTDFVPLTRNDDVICTQYNMTELEELGLLKMDFLGLRTLTVIQNAIDAVKKNHGVKIDLTKIDRTDKNVLELFNKAETIGIFQFESAGMRAFLKELKADVFEDLVAANSLFRPGPMNQIPKFIKSKHDPSKISYIHPSLEKILKPTYGCIVYQEQVMQIVRKIGGFSLGQADNVRRAMSKKKMAVMEDYRQKFIYGQVSESGEILIPGAIRNGVDEISATKIYDLMIDFANYAFNKSHSVAYSVVAFQTAYLKKYYTPEYMAALLSSVIGDTKQVVLYIEECKKLGIKILRPDVNKSFANFVTEDENIRFGLLAIKGMGKNAIEAIVKAREKGGEFTSIKDFIIRTAKADSHALNRRNSENLIRSGALDALIPSRSKAMFVFEEILDSALDDQRRNLDGQVSLFGEKVIKDSIYYPNAPNFTKKDLYEMEKDVTGIYITGHPLEQYEDFINEMNVFSAAEITSDDNFKFKDSQQIRLAGMIVSEKRLFTKKNQLMSFLTLEDLTSQIELIVFPSVFERTKNIVKEGAVVIVSGKLSISDVEDTKILVDSIQPVENFFTKKLYLQLEERADMKLLDSVVEILNKFKGNTPVVFYFRKEKLTTRNNNLKIDLKQIDDLKNALLKVLGEKDIVVR